MRSLDEREERASMRVIYAMIALVLAAAMTVAHAQAPTGQSIDELVSAAKAAAGVEWTATLARLCIPLPRLPLEVAGQEPAARRRGRSGTQSQRRSPTTSLSSERRLTIRGLSSAATVSWFWRRIRLCGASSGRDE